MKASHSRGPGLKKTFKKEKRVSREGAGAGIPMLMAS